ncbi:MAG: DNA recombination protein RmuC [Eubacteriales bacterium]
MMENMLITVLVLLGVSLIINAITLVKLFTKQEGDGKVYFDLIRDQLQSMRKEMGQQDAENRKEQGSLFQQFSDHNIKAINNISKNNQELMLSLNKTVGDSLKNIQQSNDKKLDDMRKTVDDKLSETLEKRLTQSFNQVSEQLMQVYKSMGEVKVLANGVGELNNVLKNVKTRGLWGEVQLELLIQDMLTEKQYEKNFQVGKGLVEFAIKMPGRQDTPLYLPIDSKFPMEDYSRLIDAQTSNDFAAMEASRKALHRRIEEEAKKIQDKYIVPPTTTEFAIMFLPIEGLYAEAIQAGLLEKLQSKYRVVVTGPATLSALLNALQMGFKTLAIEEHSVKIWNTLGEIKKGFANFANTLDKTRKSLDAAQNHLKTASGNANTIHAKLKRVDTLEEPVQLNLLEGVEPTDESES